MIVRWRLDELPAVLAELGVRRPFLLASPRWRSLELPPVAGRHEELPTPEVAVPADADGILAVGGGSAIDTGKHASAETGLPLPATLRELDLEELIPVVEQIQAERGVVTAG